MVYRGQLFVAKKCGELLKIGKITPQGMRRNISLIFQIREEIKNVLLHEDTVAYQAGICKGSQFGVGSEE